MPSLPVLVVYLFVSLWWPSAAMAGERRTPRPLDAWSAETLARALDRSPLARELVAQLERSNLVVHIESSMVMPQGLGGMTNFVTSAGGYRYVRIFLARDLPPADRAAMLGHELQHACEIAASGAGTVDEVRRLYAGIGDGRRGPVELFETRAAVLAGRRVWVELRTGKAEARATISAPR